MAAPSWYISVHDGRHNALGMYTDCASNGLHLQHEGLAWRLADAHYKRDKGLLCNPKHDQMCALFKGMMCP